MLRSLDEPGEFLDAASPLLLEDEARHNLILGIAGTLRDSPELYPERRLWLVEDGADVVAAALRTPPFNLVLARPRAEDALDRLAELDDALPGVTGAVPEVEAFAARWAERTRATPRPRMRQGVYALERIEPVAADRPLLLEWLRAFGAEALDEEQADEERLAQLVEYRLGSPAAGFRLWDDGGPVSLAGFGGGTPNGIRVGPVYTPPELRGRGYASALVAALSAELLAGGRRFCFLYTDLANPTSNRIYERIGYRRVCESAEIRFE
ncbi:MAG: GNAT family N-acetyltransferase [Gaiellaceae bacterium]